ncbi:MAG TPA: Fic family protein, partial [Anaerolineales bacterium]|nr:Fic family protein [Anaerolineales bacterium]
HYQFEAIHPFLDGNGRLGRLLIILLLCEWGLLPQPLMYLSAYFDANRQEYYQQLLAISQRGDWEAWLLFFLRGVRDQARESALRLARLKDLRATFQQRLQGERTLARLMQVVDFLLGSPIVSVRQVQAGIGASDYKIAQRCVTRLEQHGIIREITGQARNRLYRVDEVMQVFLDPPG